MFDLGWSEMMLVGVIALSVVGPKELPTLFRSVGQAVGKARGMAREFTRAMEAAADEAGVKEINRTINAATRPVQFGTDTLRQATMGPRTTAGKPPGSAAPLNPGTPVKPGGATDALATQRADERVNFQQDAAKRAAARDVSEGEVRAAEQHAAASPSDHMPPDRTS